MNGIEFRMCMFVVLHMLLEVRSSRLVTAVVPLRVCGCTERVPGMSTFAHNLSCCHLCTALEASVCTTITFPCYLQID